MVALHMPSVMIDLEDSTRAEKARKSKGYLLAYTGWETVPGGKVTRLENGQWETATADDAYRVTRLECEGTDDGTARALMGQTRDAVKTLSGGSSSPDTSLLPAAPLTPTSPTGIAFSDAVYDMRTFANTGESLPYYRATVSFPGTPDSWETHEDARRLLAGVFGSLEVARHVGTILGASMLGPSVAPQKGVYLKGGGGTGKSLLVELLSELLGQSATQLSAVAFSSRSGTDREESRLKTEGRRVAFVNEFPHKAFDVEYFKSLTGGDIVRGRAPYQGSREWRSECTPVFVSNELPALGGESSSLLRRMVVIQCAARLPEGLRLGVLSSSRRVALVRQLGQWIADGARRSLGVGAVEAACEAVSSTAAVMEESDSFSAWTTNVVVFKPGDEPADVSFASYGATRDKLWDGYVEHCRRGGYQRLSRPQFFDRLKGLGANSYRVTGGQGRCRCWNVHVLTEQELDAGVEGGGVVVGAVSAPVSDREVELEGEVEALRARLAELEAMVGRASQEPVKAPEAAGGDDWEPVEASPEPVSGPGGPLVPVRPEQTYLDAYYEAMGAIADGRATTNETTVPAPLPEEAEKELAEFAALADRSDDDAFLADRADSDHYKAVCEDPLNGLVAGPAEAQAIIGEPVPLTLRSDDSLPAVVVEGRGPAYIPMSRIDRPLVGNTPQEGKGK